MELLAWPQFDVLAIAIVSFGIVIIVKAVVDGLFKPLLAVTPHLPYVGDFLTHILRVTYQSVSHSMGRAEASIDHTLGVSFHTLAHNTNFLWSEFRAHATLIAEIATGLYPLVVAIHGVRSLVHHLTRSSATHATQVKTLRRDLVHVERQIRALEHEVRVGIGDDVLPRLKTLDREVARINSQAIPAIQAADAQASKAISDLWTWIHKHIALPGTATFTGAVAIAFSALGLGGLRCPGFLNLLSKRGCGLGGLLDALLGLAISALALENVCRLLPFLEDAFGHVVGPVTHLLTEVPLGDCEKPPKGWATLSVAAGPLPPPQKLGAFPG